MTFRRLLLVVLLGGSAAGAQPPFPVEQKAELRLSAERGPHPAGGEAGLRAEVVIERGWHTNSHTPTFDYLIPTVVTLELPAGFSPPRVDYPPGEMKRFAFADQPISVYEGTVAIPIRLSLPPSTPQGPLRVAGKLRYQACNDRLCLPPVETTAQVEIEIGAAAAEAPATPPAPGSAALGSSPPAAPGGRGLAWILLLGFVGGLILNAMPCVLPVLSLKVFGLVRSAGAGRSHVVVGALATALGIVGSFWALAGAAAVARAAGQAVGWGIQFQEPAFVAFLAVIVILFCLNLWGLFEIALPGRLARAADAAQGGEGIAGHFASGLFATLMATPCSAPFLGTAVGFALSQPTAVVFAVFTAVGLGMALPYLILAAAPGTARLLPRPGAWMDQLKTVMGFLLAGAAIWLFYVLASQVSPERLALLQLGLLLLALFAWMRHRNFGRAGARRAAALGMLAAAAFTLWVAAGAAPVASIARGAQAAPARRLIAWVSWSRGEAESLAREGRLVFVDVTADWCFTCKVNERLVLETPEVAAAFTRHQVIAMKADWTNRDDEIARFLADFGRSGIPFYLLYRPGREPHLFAELLTKDGLLRELEAAARSSATASH
jgi:suppressor for copper-sensitivity B